MAISLYDDKRRINALIDCIRQSRSRAEVSYLYGVTSYKCKQNLIEVARAYVIFPTYLYKPEQNTVYKLLVDCNLVIAWLGSGEQINNP